MEMILSFWGSGNFRWVPPGRAVQKLQVLPIVKPKLLRSTSRLENLDTQRSQWKLTPGCFDFFCGMTSYPVYAGDYSINRKNKDPGTQTTSISLKVSEVFLSWLNWVLSPKNAGISWKRNTIWNPILCRWDWNPKRPIRSGIGRCLDLKGIWVW